MSGKSCMKITLAICALWAAVSGAAWSRDGGEASAAALPWPQVEETFQAMVEDARQISRLLGEVTDRETADRVAGELEQALAHMNEKLQALEGYSFRREQDAEALKQHMATLTHVSQSYLATMQRLAEVQAYGSSALSGVMQRYKMDGDRLSHLRADDLPHTPLYNELADSLEDALYSLSKVQDEAGAAGAAPALRELLQRISHAHHLLEQLAPPHTDEQKEVVRPVRERLRQALGELQKENERIKAAQYYNNRELEALLPRLLQVAVFR